MVTKVTFSVDDETIEQLTRTAERLRRSKSQVVREAIQEYAARADRLTEAERQRLLKDLEECLRRIPERPAADVDRELAALRRARRSGGRAGRGQ
jgi:predicted transcriptional regulator